MPMMTSDELYGQLRKDHFIFAGPCALESFELALDTAHAVAEASKEGRTVCRLQEFVG
mgnify:CR=1 FL=1